MWPLSLRGGGGLRASKKRTFIFCGFPKSKGDKYENNFIYFLTKKIILSSASPYYLTMENNKCPKNYHKSVLHLLKRT